MEMENTNFINIDTNWSNTNYTILFPRKYEVAAKEKVIHLAAFLHKTYGNRILTSFDPVTQLTIKETTWENGKPISKLDRELDDILESDDNIDYVDILHSYIRYIQSCLWYKHLDDLLGTMVRLQIKKPLF